MINILVPTIDSRINNVKNVIQDKREDVRYLISHQYTSDQYLHTPHELIRDDVVISRLEGKGVARNRNNTLRMMGDGLGVISDDDLKYFPDSFDMVNKVFDDNSDLDVACFKIKTLEGEPEYKEYPKQAIRFENHKHHYVSCVEIVFRIDSIRNNNIWFDERFGLSSERIKSGEEHIFIEDCIKAGLNVKFFPDYFVIHPFQSSGKKYSRFDREKNEIRGAIHARVHGWKAIPIAVIETVRFFLLLLKENQNPLNYLTDRLKGILYIYKTNKYQS